ncbi:MAG: DUF370 domain-containing protein [Eubacteriales bacterium]
MMKLLRKKTGTAWKRLDIGAHTAVPQDAVLGIFDMDTATVSAVTKKYLNHAQKAGRLENVSDELPKSFVVLSENDAAGAAGAAGAETERVLLSRFAPATLVQR